MVSVTCDDTTPLKISSGFSSSDISRPMTESNRTRCSPCHRSETTSMLRRREAPSGAIRGRVWERGRVAARGRVWERTLATLLGAGVAFVPGVVSAAEPGPAPVPESPGSLYHLVDQIGARSLWEQGVTGAGVNVAVIDTGVAPVAALSGSKVVAAVDLSTEQDDPATAFVDNYGHGTHLAGIIAGRDPEADPALAAEHPEWFVGVAPDAGIVSVKVAGRDGRVSLAGLISGIDFVAEHADELDIGVLAIAFNSDWERPYYQDPIAAAVERAWAAGVVVVTAAGNGGATADGLYSPANDPYVISVGGVEGTDAGFVPVEWASTGDGTRNPDLAAPGSHIASLRAPGSYADVEHPEGYVDDRLFLASGSSQSAAVVAGAAALLLDADPGLTPDQVKARLIAGAAPIDGADESTVGAGVLDVSVAATAVTDDAEQNWRRARGHRVVRAPGSVIVNHDAVDSWTSSSWMSSSWMSSSWMSSSWMSSSWMSSSWMSSSWMSSSWMSSSWMSSSWMSSSWMSSSWMSSSWMSSSWMSSSWMSGSWMSSSWMSSSWMSSSWMSSSWMSSSWMSRVRG
jgi:serine protease AprX